MIREFLKLLRKDDLLTQAGAECEEMLALCNSMVRAAVESLRQRDDADIALDLYGLDKKLNAFERDVRRKVMTHLSLGHDEDLSAGLGLVSIVIDIERIGDYSKNILDLARAHPGRLQGGVLEDRLAEVERETLDYFARVVEAFASGDQGAASALMKEYKADISGTCADLERLLVSQDLGLAANDAVATALYLRFLKRIGGHARNLISSLVNPFHRIGYKEKPSGSK
jgi:phosphate uptake regulator